MKPLWWYPALGFLCFTSLSYGFYAGFSTQKQDQKIRQEIREIDKELKQIDDNERRRKAKEGPHWWEK